MTVTKEFFLAEGERYEYLLTRKNIKRIYLRVNRDGSLAVSAPFPAPIARIEAFLCGEVGFIRKARQKLAAAREGEEPLHAVTGEVVPVFGVPHTLTVEAGRRPTVLCRDGRLELTVKNPDNHEERIRVLKNWMWAEARETLSALCREVYPRFAPEPPAFPTLIFRQMTSKWGVCRPMRNTVTLNLNLFFLPRELCEYVVYHEFAHFRHPDHSAAFWQWLTRFLPDCKERRRALRAVRIPELSEPGSKTPAEGL